MGRRIFRDLALVAICVLGVLRNTQCYIAPEPDHSAVKDSMHQFVKHAYSMVTKSDLEKLDRYFKIHCTNVENSKLKFNHTELVENDKRLASFLRFTRKDPQSVPIENASPSDVLSFWGWVIFLVPLTFMASSSLSLVAAIMFFYCPKLNARFFNFFFKGEAKTIEIVDDRTLSTEELEYYRITKNSLSRQKSLFKLFVFKFGFSLLLMLSLLFGLGILINFDTSADCGMANAAKNVIEGEDGNYFSEFGVHNKNTLLHKFTKELKSFQHRSDIDYESIIKSDPLQKAVLLQDHLNTWYSSLAQKKKDDHEKSLEYVHPLESHLSPFVNQEIKRDLKAIVSYATHLSKGATELMLLRQNHDERIQQFLNQSQIISKQVDLVNFDIFKIYMQVRAFFQSYYQLLAVMALCSFSWFIYSFSMMIPTKSDEPALFSKPCGIVFLVLGSCVFSVLGSILFLRSQLLISDCHRSVKLLDHPDMVHKLYSGSDIEWANICVSEYATGDMSLFLKDGEAISEFKKPLSILTAFSSNITAFDFSKKVYEPESLQKYAVAVDAYREFKLPDNTTNPQQEGYTVLLYKINFLCQKFNIPDKFVLNPEQCVSGQRVVSSLEDFHKPRAIPSGFAYSKASDSDFECVVLRQMEIAKISLTQRYTYYQFDFEVSDLLKKLDRRLQQVESFLEDWETNVLALRLRVHVLYDVAKQSKPVSDKIKSQFHESILEYEKQNKSIEKMMNCKVLRDEVISAVGSACHQQTYTYGSMITSLCFMFAALFSSLLGLINFMEVMVDKTVIRKYQEIQDKSYEESQPKSNPESNAIELI